MIALPHICLRCQLRLARRAPSRVQAAFHSSSAHSTNLPNQPSKANGEHETIKQPFIKPEYLHQTNLSHRPLETQSTLQRLHGQNGKKLREDRERLDIDALGKPADVIVLRDSKISTYNHVKVIEPDEEPQSIDILATLDSERGLPGQQEIVENINQFRPKEGEEPQDWDAFNSLVTDIQSSFTASQLGCYIQSFTKSHGDDQSTQRDRQLIPRISSWTPKKSHASQCSDDSYTRGYSLASYTNKQILAFRILQECWKVELDETVGEVELELKSKDYALLLRGSRPILGVIAAEYINREDERIDGFRSKHIIRITSTRRKSELIISEIERTLRNIRQEEIYLGDLARPGSSRNRMWKWIDTQFNSSTIKFLSDLTNTEIDVLPKKRLRISCIDTKPGSVKGNKVDIVLRYLMTSENISNRITNWLGCRETAKASSGVFMAFTAIEGLGWRDRLRQWTRWTAPITKKANPQDVPQQDVPQHSSTTLEQSANILTASPKINGEPQSVDVGQELVANAILQSQNSQTGGNSMSKNDHDGSLHWEDRYRIESSALIGCVLHSYADSSKPSAMASLPIGKASKSRMHRTFSTAVPNLSKLFGSTSMQDVRRVGPHRTLIMNFQPNPFFKSRETSQSIGAAALSAFPPLEMRFSIDEDNNSYILRDIQAIVSVRNSDFMLPESVSDVRFQQRTVSTLVVRPEHYPPSLAKFLSDSSLDIEHGYFDAPPKLTIPIAAHLCQGSGFDLLGGDKTGADMQDVEYLFTGLDIRKRVMMSWEGWRLHYTSIEAGKAGGRRGELRLIPVRLDSVSTAATEEEFLESACRLADGAEGGGVEQSVVRAVHIPKPVRKIWTDGGRAGAYHKIPRFFTKRVDIRHPEVQESETMHMANMQELSEHLAELEEKESRFGKDGDEDEFA